MFSQTVEYAVRAMNCLARQPEGTRMPSAEIADLARIPHDYLSKILKQLNRAGFVRSTRGPGGGHELARSPSRVTILDIVNAVEPLPRIRTCPLGLLDEKHCVELCPLHRKLDDVLATIEDALGSTTLAEVSKTPDTTAGRCLGPGGRVATAKERR